MWSWHIWVNNSSPAQLSKAIPYTTYAWDETGIHTDKPRVKGKSVMSCNLGALADEPGDDPQKTYGLWYQWGRKDPFPSGKEAYHMDVYDYTNEYIIDTYDAQGQKILMTDPYLKDELFRILATDNTRGTIEYVLKHPTHFLRDETSDKINQDDWYWGHEDRLWGGEPF